MYTIIVTIKPTINQEGLGLTFEPYYEAKIIREKVEVIPLVPQAGISGYRIIERGEE